MPKKIDLTGLRFGRLTVISESPTKKWNKVAWVCKCDCGNITHPVTGEALKSGNTKSCGCLHTEELKARLTKHGKKGSRIYRIWRGVKNRCLNSKAKDYKYYGGRGITVCDEWRDDFSAFAEWALSHGYSESLTIDRIDNDGNYEPLNCRWVNMQTQNKIKSYSVISPEEVNEA